MSQSTDYRPDLDGLRALAVLSVILFHYDLSAFSGGFVGVDIFFVISGFLIIRIITRALREGSFSLFEFWERRVRRIVPALVVVLIATTLASYFYIRLPADFSQFGWSLIFQSLFVSNVWFMGQSNYFAAPVESMPLLHLWTLAVEEQFYLLFPLLAAGLFPYLKDRLRHVMLGLALCSLLYGIHLTIIAPTDRFTIPLLPHLWGSADNASAGFYFLGARLWELLVGGLIAVWALSLRHKHAAQFASLAGFGAIALSITTFSSETPFPGVAALVPVLGTAAIIVSNTHHRTWIATLLSAPLLVWTGLLSYSLYLWHWPLLVFATYPLYHHETLSGATLFVLLLLTFIAAAVTYYCVETPIRQRRFLTNRTHLFLAAILSIVVLIVAGRSIITHNGFPDRVPPDAQIVARAITDTNPRQAECFTKSSITAAVATPCLLGAQDPERIEFVLWGDSHANATMPAFDRYGIETETTGIFFGTTACPPLISEQPLTTNQRCLAETQAALSFIQSATPKEVFLVAEWREGYNFANDSVGPPLSTLLSETLAAFPTSTRVTILHRIPTYPDYDFRDLFLQIADGYVTFKNTMPRASFEVPLRPIARAINAAATTREHTRTLDPLSTLCNDNECFNGNADGMFYHDSSHLSTHGAYTVILPLLLETTTSTHR